MKNTKANFSYVELIILVVIVAITTSLCTGLITYKKTLKNNNKQEIKSKYLKEFNDVYMAIIENYYDEVDESSLINAALASITENLSDPYTSVLNESQTDKLLNELNGKYTGIGIKVIDIEEEGIQVVEVYDNTPASIANIQVGDYIRKINDLDLGNKTSINLENYINEIENNKSFTLTIERNNNRIETTLTKQLLDIPSISFETINNIGYAKISLFSSSTVDQMKSILNKLNQENIGKLILDVRDNYGGYLKSASDITKLFLKEESIIYSVDNKNNETIYKDDTKEYSDLELVILINENTASASELMASALHDSYKATTVGTTTYGKGKIQQTITLNNGSMIKYTSSLWYTPNHINIDNIGLKPDYIINNISNIDNQLNYAIELLK